MKQPAIIIIVLGLAACAGTPAAETGRPLTAVTAIAPIAWLVERVGGQHVTVSTLVQPGQDPHTYAPTPRQIADLTRANLFFKAGLPLEARLLDKVPPDRPRVIDVGAGVPRRMMEPDPDEPASGQGQSDPHIWLAPPLLKIEAGNVAAALGAADPTHANEYEANLAALRAELEAADARLRAELAPFKGRTFYVFHPAFGYFADAYGLHQAAVEIEGKSPAPKQLAGLIARAKAEGVKIVFVQPQFDPRAAETVASAIGGGVAPMDDLAPDVIKNLETMAAAIAAALGGG